MVKKSEKTHNGNLCNRGGARCVHCCTLCYGFQKSFFDKIFGQRRELFNRTVQRFPEDLSKYAGACSKAEEVLDFLSLGRLPCIYVGSVDSSPGCMIHPSLHQGLDFRADEELTGTKCLPSHGCYFDNYLRTPAEKRIFEEVMAGDQDWYSYSKNLRDCALFNKQNGYILARLPEPRVNVEMVANAKEEIHKNLGRRFPRPEINRGWAKDLGVISPTEEYIQGSPLFVAWGLGLILSERDTQKQRHFEKRFKLKDFSEWAYYNDPEKVMYIYRPLGEILPITFDDVEITEDSCLAEAITIVDATLRKFSAGVLASGEFS